MQTHLSGPRKALYLLQHNPTLFLKKSAAWVNALKPLPETPVQRRLRGVTFEFDTRRDYIMCQAYRNLYELEVVDLLRRLLPRGGVYLDVGANVGFLCAIAAGAVGAEGEVHAFEPVPRNFEKLQRLVELNPGRHIVANAFAVGAEDGSAEIEVSSTTNQGLHTIVPGMLDPDTVAETITVPVRTLDGYIRENIHRSVSFIKIDTEGYEFPVLQGLSGYLEDSDDRPFIFVEVTPEAWTRLGYGMADLQAWMNRHGYGAWNLLNVREPVDVRSITEQENVLLRPVGRARSAGGRRNETGRKAVV